MNNEIIIAGIVTYNPSIERLKENISAVVNQVSQLVIVDNGSKNIDDIEACIKDIPTATIIRHNKNLGIATALNTMFKFASKRGNWVLTLDQDSVFYPNMIKTYRKYMNMKNVVSLTSQRDDRHYASLEKANNEAHSVFGCITSGNLVKISAWDKVGGFNDKLFIDMVDYEFCKKLKLANYKILCVNQPLMIHELGDSRTYPILGRRINVYNHSAFRKYYIFRNTIYMLRYYSSKGCSYSYTYLIKTFLKIIIIENNKYEKLKRSIQGIRDGFKMEF